MVPLRAVVAVPELQLSTSWVDFGTCFVNQDQVREVYLMNLSSCRSYWAVLTGESCLPLAPCSPVLQACVPCALVLRALVQDHLGISAQLASSPIPQARPAAHSQDAGWESAPCVVCPFPYAGQQEPDKDPVAFRVSPSSGLLEARLGNAPPTSITLQVSFTARYSLSPSHWHCPAGPRALAQGPCLISIPAPHRSCKLYKSTLVVEGVLGEKSCTLRLRGEGSYDEKYESPHQL